MGKITRFLHPATMREAVRNFAIAIVWLVISTWLVALLTQLKVFDNPQHQVSEVTQFFSWLTAESWFHWLSGIAVGFGAGVWLDAYMVRRAAKRWWEHLQCFSIRDAGCLLAGIKLGEFEKSDRAVAIANELRGYVNSGHVPLFLELEFEKPLPDLSDPKARYEPPYDKKNVGFDALIPKRFLENMARGRNWPLPWALPPQEEGDNALRPLKRPKPIPAISPAPVTLGLLAGMFATGAKETKSEGEK